MAKKVGETKGIIIYGPYLHKASGQVVWYVIQPVGRKEYLNRN